MVAQNGKVVLRRKEELVYELTLEERNYQSPFFPISIYCNGKCIEGHFIIKRRDPAEFESPLAMGITSTLQPDGEIGIAHSKEELINKMYERAVKLAKAHVKGGGFEFVDRTKERDLEKTANDREEDEYSLSYPFLSPL